MEMLAYQELIELRENLYDGKVSVDTATELYWKDFKEGTQSWHTKDWKERRAKVIKEKCQICDSTEILTIQHLSHPRKYSELKLEVTRVYAKEFIDKNTLINKDEFIKYINKNYDYVPIPYCPNCNWSNPSIRVKKTPKYRCLGCKHEFDHANYKSIKELIEVFYKDEQALELRDKCFFSKAWRNQHNLSSVRYWM